MNKEYCVTGAGLGLRRGPMVQEFLDQRPEQVQFMEVAPENWAGFGGKIKKRFRQFADIIPFVTHGLSLSIGGPAPLDEEFVKQVKNFLAEYNIRKYTDHLTYCSDDGHLYDLMPIPFTEEAVHYVAGRIRRVQDIMEQTIAVENASYYAAPGQEMKEIDFINAVIDEAQCELLLDVNNIYVNSVNHGYDSTEFLQALPGDKIVYAHIAGHYNEDKDLIVDTHGADVIDPVWQILDKAYETFGVFPTLLERDFNIPPLEVLLKEVDRIVELQEKWNPAKSTVAANA